MATKEKPQESVESQGSVEEYPNIEDVSEMPVPRRGRTSMDLTMFEELLKDSKPHVINDIADRNARERWARRIRQAAENIGLEVETTYRENEQRLYFRGWKKGEAPARGRRSAATRKTTKASASAAS